MVKWYYHFLGSWHIKYRLPFPISQGAPGLGQEDFLQTKLRQNGAFITRFKPETQSIQFLTTNAIPVNKWPYREKASYDAMLALAAAIKNFQARNNGERPEAITRCGLEKKSPLIQDLAEVWLRVEKAYRPKTSENVVTILSKGLISSKTIYQMFISVKLSPLPLKYIFVLLLLFRWTILFYQHSLLSGYAFDYISLFRLRFIILKVGYSESSIQFEVIPNPKPYPNPT